MIRNYLTNSVTRSPFRRRNLLRSLLVAPTLLFLLSVGGTTFAGSATWSLNRVSGDWNTAANWTPPTVPNGPADTATFDVSTTTNISVPLLFAFEVDGIVFNPGASAYTVTLPS